MIAFLIISIPCIDNNVRRVVARARQLISCIFRRSIVLLYHESFQMKQWFGLWRWLFCDPIFKNNILSRPHKAYVIGYIVAHHFGGAFNWWSYLFHLDARKFVFLIARTGHNFTDSINARDNTSIFCYIALCIVYSL